MKKKFIFVLLFTFFLWSTCLCVNAKETINISNQEEYFSAIATINSSDEEEFIMNLTDDIILDNYPSTDNPVLIGNNKIVTILGNNHKIKISNTGSYGYHSILSVGSATVNLGNSDGTDVLGFEGGGTIVNTSESLINVGGTVNMYNGVSLSENHSGVGALTGGAFRIQSYGELNMYGGNIHDNSSTAACLGGAITLTADKGTFNMYDGIIENNRTCNGTSDAAYGGAIYVDADATVKIEGGTIRGNSSSYGGAIGLLAGSLTITGGTFEDNESSAYGGFIMTRYNPVFSVSNATFKNNSSKFGGAIAVVGGTVNINNSLFQGNEASSSGGALLVATGTVSSESNRYIGNAALYGGAIRSQGEIVSDKDIITSNEGKTGGGLYLNGGTANFLTSDVYNNKAVTSANDVYITSGVSSFKIKDVTNSDKVAVFDDTNVTIDGWYEDIADPRYTFANPTTKFDYASLKATGTFYLTAAGSDEVVAIKFNIDGVTLDDVYLNKGDKLTPFDNPTRDDYTFVGWYTDENFDNPFDFDTSIDSSITLYGKWEFNYKITNGVNQTYENENLIITCNGDLSKLVNIKINGNVLDEANYSVRSGSTILTLNNDYLSTLAAGEYTVTFVYNDGSAETTFKIESSAVQSSSGNPKTGDNIISYLIILLVCSSGLAIVKFYSKKIA